MSRTNHTSESVVSTGNGEAPPPLLLGGILSQTAPSPCQEGPVRLHWLRGTCPMLGLDELATRIDQCFQGGPQVKEHAQYRYELAYCWQPWGVELCFDDDPASQRHGNRALLIVPGQALDHLGPEQQLLLLKDLHNRFGFTATRIDCAFDDYERVITPSQLNEALVAERVISKGFLLCDPKHPRRDGVIDCDQINFGRRGKDGSGKFLRIYDKALQGEGMNCIRWEAEFSGKRARGVADALSQADSVPALAGLLGGFVAGSIDFVEPTGRAGDKNLSRLKRPDWWQQLQSRMGEARTMPNRIPVPTLVGKVEWIANSVAPTLALLREAYGEEDFAHWIESAVRKATHRLTEKHIRILKSFHAEAHWPSLTAQSDATVPTGRHRVSRQFVRLNALRGQRRRRH